MVRPVMTMLLLLLLSLVRVHGWEFDDRTLLLLNPAEGVTARIPQNELTPESRPQIREIDGKKYYVFDEKRFFEFPAGRILTGRSGTFELYLRNIAKVDNYNHLFGIFNHDASRHYFRINNAGQLHYLFFNYGALRQNMSVSGDGVSAPGDISHLALQWDHSDDGKCRIEIYRNGQRIEDRTYELAPLEIRDATRLFIGGYTGGKLPASSFAAGPIRISSGRRYDGAAPEITAEIAVLTGAEGLQQAKRSLADDRFTKEEKQQMATKIRQIETDIAGKRNISAALTALNQLIDRLKINAFNRALKTPGVSGTTHRLWYDSTARKAPNLKKDYRPLPQSPLRLTMAGNEWESAVFAVASDASTQQQYAIRVEFDHPAIVRSQLYRIAHLGNQFADPLLPVDGPQVVGPDEVGLFWLDVRSAHDAPAGEIRGKVVVTAADGGRQELPIAVRIWNFTLPTTPALKTAFGLSPEYISAWTLNSAEPIDRLTDRYVRQLLDYKISPKSCSRFSLVLSADQQAAAIAAGGRPESAKQTILPSNKNFLHPRQILKKDGSIKIDFTAFDRQAKEYLALGLTSFIAANRFWDAQNNARDILASGRSLDTLDHLLDVHDEATGKEKTLKLKIFSREYQAIMQSVFRQWQDYLKREKLLPYAYSYIIDEPTPAMEPMGRRLYELAAGGAPEIPHLITGVSHLPQVENVGIWCLQFTAMPGTAERERRIGAGQQFWYYVCRDPRPPYANFHLNQQPVDHRILFWQTARHHGTGFLYWELNFWSSDPMAWQRGEAFSRIQDGVLLYPGKDGPIFSLRLAHIRDGIEDCDYIAILRKMLAEKRIAAPDLKRAEHLANIPGDLTESPTKYTRDFAKIESLRHEIGEIIHRNHTR